jgi:glutathione S-transferase
MILIGQYDSAFVRRVGIALRLYDLPFTHRPWSVFGDRDRLMAVNPLGSVPVLLLEDATPLPDSKAILDHLDGLVPAAAQLWPHDGLTDRFVSLFYERRLHQAPSPVLTDRREAQVRATLAALEQARAAAPGDWLFGSRLTHADIALACALRHLRESLPDLFDVYSLPALTAHAARAEGLAVFREISQPFLAPT